MLVTNLLGRRVCVRTPAYPTCEGELVAVYLEGTTTNSERLQFVVLLDHGDLTYNLDYNDFTVIKD